jgi:hypothetical protein
MANRTVEINRAPVLTLWASVVAERLGYNRDEALTLGKALAGLNAQSKGRRLGIYQAPSEETAKKARERKKGEEYTVMLMGRTIPVVLTDDGVRATTEGRPTSPASVEHYLKGKFGEALPDVQSAMEKLARSLTPRQLATRAYSLYESFRPEIPEGTKGWGAKGELDLDKIRSLVGKDKEPMSKHNGR